MRNISKELFQLRRLESIPRAKRPRCGARTRAGTLCMAQALINGKCRQHGGLSTGIRTLAGLKRQREAASKFMKAKWKAVKAEGRTTLRNPAPAADSSARKVKRKRQTAATHALALGAIPRRGVTSAPDLNVTAWIEAASAELSESLERFRHQAVDTDFSAMLKEGAEARRSGKLDPQASEEALKQALRALDLNAPARG